MNDLAAPTIAFSLLILAVGILGLVKPRAMNDFFNRILVSIYGSTRAERFSIRGSRTSAGVAVVAAIAILAVGIFVFLPA